MFEAAQRVKARLDSAFADPAHREQYWRAFKSFVQGQVGCLCWGSCGRNPAQPLGGATVDQSRVGRMRPPQPGPPEWCRSFAATSMRNSKAHGLSVLASAGLHNEFVLAIFGTADRTTAGAARSSACVFGQPLTARVAS